MIVLLGLVECDERKRRSGLRGWVTERISLSGLSRFLSKWPSSPVEVAHTWAVRFRQRQEGLVQGESVAFASKIEMVTHQIEGFEPAAGTQTHVLIDSWYHCRAAQERSWEVSGA